MHRYLIVNADDFGLSAGVNHGIARAHERGIVTSASLMVRQPAAAEAAEYAKRHPRLGVGLHLDLGEWAYRDGHWVTVYEVVPADDAGAGAAEVARQLAAFRDLLGREPTHIDSHQHVHRSEPLLSTIRRVADDLSVPLRHAAPHVRYAGDFYGQSGKGWPAPEAISVASLVRLLSSLTAGVTELACHPGEDKELRSPYRDERFQEVRTLRDPRVRAAVARHGIRLVSFAGVAELLRE